MLQGVLWQAVLLSQAILRYTWVKCANLCGKFDESLHLINNIMSTEEYFRDLLLEHYHHPRNAGTIAAPDFSSSEYNHSCGDQVQIQGQMQNFVITRLAFIGSGCLLSQAVASMLTEACVGKTAQQILALNKDFVLGLVGSSLGPTRLRCALLPLYALQQGLQSYMQKDSSVVE